MPSSKSRRANLHTEVVPTKRPRVGEGDGRNEWMRALTLFGMYRILSEIYKRKVLVTKK